jgi:two-component system probable response regulator PhcQ
MSNHVHIAPLILFVDDEATAVKYFQRAIDSLAPVITAGTVEDGRRMLDEHASSLAVLVTDQRMPGGYGNELLHYASIRYPHMVRILTTAYSELEHTVEAVNQGKIHRYIQKPWEISALRMELKQALELAALRKDHALLLREKMSVLQSNIVSNRIGTIYTLCATLSGPENFPAVDNYLAAAATLPWNSPQTELTDHAEQVAAEAMRSGEFGHAVSARLTGIMQRHPAVDEEIKLLSELLGDKVQVSGCDTVVFTEEKIFSEFLETNSPVSPSHAIWLACLIWLGSQGRSLQFTRLDKGLEGRLVSASGSAAPSGLAAWIDRFCDR